MDDEKDSEMEEMFERARPSRATKTTTTADRATPNPAGTVRQERSGRWSASYRRDGQTHRASGTFESQADAYAWLSAQRRAHRTGTWRDPSAGSVTLAAYAERWMRARKLAPRTRAAYQHSLDRWILPRLESVSGVGGVALGELPLTALTRDLVREWHGYVMELARESKLGLDLRRSRRRESPARVWARRNGYPVRPTGRLSPAVVNTWRDAGSPDLGYVDVRTANPNAGSAAAAHAYALLRAITTTAVVDRIMPEAVCIIGGAGTVDPDERPTLSPDEVKALADHFPEPLRAAVHVAAWSGLRFGELFALSRRHIDLENGTIRVERAVHTFVGKPAEFGGLKTKQSRRTVVLPAFAVAILRAHMARFVPINPDALIFTNPASGEPMNSRTIMRYIAPARAAIGRPEVHWHDLRHTGATHAYYAGATERDVMNRLGHSTPRAAAIYRHAVSGADRNLADRMNELYG